MTSANPARKHSRGKIVGVIVSVILTILFIYIAFSGVDLFKMWEIISDSSLGWILVFIVSSLISHYLRALRWGVILSSIKQSTSSYNLFSSLMIGYGVNNIIPRLGEVTRAVSLGELEKISRASVLGTIVVERVLDILFFGLAVIVSAALYSGDIYLRVPWLHATIYIGSVIISIIIIGLIAAVYYRKKIESYAAIHGTKPNFKERFVEFVVKLIHGFSSLKGVGNYSLTLLYSAGIMFFYALTSYFGLFVLGMHELHPVDYLTGWVIMSVSAIGIMIPTPGGIGSYHAITKTALVELYGFNPEISLAYATMTHGTAFLLQVITGLLFFFLLRKKYSYFNKNILRGIDDEQK